MHGDDNELLCFAFYFRQNPSFLTFRLLEGSLLGPVAFSSFLRYPRISCPSSFFFPPVCPLTKCFCFFAFGMSLRVRFFLFCFTFLRVIVFPGPAVVTGWIFVVVVHLGLCMGTQFCSSALTLEVLFRPTPCPRLIYHFICFLSAARAPPFLFLTYSTSLVSCL